MGMNPHSPDSPPPDDAAALDDLAAYALDAVDLDEAVTIEARLATDPSAADLVLDLRDAAGAYGAAFTDESAAPPALRARVLEAAHAARPPSPIEPASAIEVHRIELERAIMLLRRLTDEQMALSLDPPEFAGWTIKDVTAHLAANEAQFLQVLGLHTPALPETETDNERRTAQVIERHQSLTAAEAIDELEACFRAVDDHVSALDAAGLEREIEWWGMDMRVLTLLIVRSFETWTHADDIRRAVGLAALPPPAPSLATMSAVATSWTPLLVADTGRDYTDTVIEIRLTGPGGALHLVPMGPGDIDLTAVEPAAAVTLDIVDYCRAIGDRRPPGGVPYTATGDADLAADLVGSLHQLASL